MKRRVSYDVNMEVASWPIAAMLLRMLVGRNWLFVCLFCFGCERPATSLVEISDPYGLAVGAKRIVLEVRDLDGTLHSEFTREIEKELPVTVAIAGVESRRLEVTATVSLDDEQVLARGRVETTLSKSTSPARLDLAEACIDDCSDGLFCNGEEGCERGICVRTEPPCQPSFECVLTECVEASDECTTTVDHSICEKSDGVSRYCSVSSGCVAGVPCTNDEQCQDGAFCNGLERCENFTCVAGPPPTIDDGSPCTVDGCNDSRPVSPVFHVQDSTKDGNTCDLSDGGQGICLSTNASVCVQSECGDGFLDPFREPCDDGNDDNTDDCIRVETSPGEVACELAACGDGFVRAGVEVCDDQNTVSGDGCREDCMKIEACGDGVIDLGEICDDGNANPNDGCDRCAETVWHARVITGLGAAGGDPLKTGLQAVGIAADNSNNLFVADAENRRIWRIDRTGISTIFAGAGARGSGGDGGPATDATFYTPYHVAVDGVGNVFIADVLNGSVRQVCAGDGTCAPGTIRTIESDSLSSPIGIALDGLGNVYVAEQTAHRVVKICNNVAGCPDGTTVVVAGNGSPDFSGDGGSATEAALKAPTGIAVDRLGNVFIADTQNHRVREVCTALPNCTPGTIRTIAGTGTPGFSGDGALAVNAQLNTPVRVALDKNDNLLIADLNNHRVRMVCRNPVSCVQGTIETIAGKGTMGFSGDGGLASQAELNLPSDVSIDSDGNLLIADQGNFRVRKVCMDGAGCGVGTIETVVGSGSPHASRDDQPATSAEIRKPRGLSIDDMGNLYFADSAQHRVRTVDRVTGLIRTVAGTGLEGFSGDGGPATDALLAFPEGVAVDGRGNVFISDSSNHRVREVCVDDPPCPVGAIRTVAGTGVQGFSGDRGPAVDARLNSPAGLAIDFDGHVLVADTNNHAIRQICRGGGACPTGEIRTVAGTGVPGLSGDDGLAIDARLSSPSDVALDTRGNIFIADTLNFRVREVCVDDTPCAPGTIRTVAGTSYGSSGDGGPATSAKFEFVQSVALDSFGNLFIADSVLTGFIRQVCAGEDGCPTGTVRRVAGSSISLSGDGGPALDAGLARVNSVAVDDQGNLYLGSGYEYPDQFDYVRQICAGEDACPAGTIRTVAGNIYPDDGPLERAALGAPMTVAAWKAGWLVADRDRVRLIDEQEDRLTTLLGGGVGYNAIAGALLVGIRGVTVDASRERFFASLSVSSTIRMFDATVDPAAVSTLPVSGLATPAGLLFDPITDRLLVADRDNHVIRSIDVLSGETEVLAGVLRTRGFSGDGGSADQALLNAPAALAWGPDGSLYVADTGNHRVRRVDTDGRIDVVVGDGTAASSGVGTPARFFPVNAPMGLATDRYGNLFVSSSTTIRLVSAGDDHIATGEDSVSTIYGTAPREVFPSSLTNCLAGLSVADPPDGEADAGLFVVDSCVGFALRLERFRAE